LQRGPSTEDWAQGRYYTCTIGQFCELGAISCPSVTTCIAVGDNGTILETTDGSSWNEQTVGGALYGVACPTTEVCYAVGTERVLKTVDGGSTWADQDTGIGGGFAAISCPTSTTCWAVRGVDTVITTSDGGMHWSLQPFPQQ